MSITQYVDNATVRFTHSKPADDTKSRARFQALDEPGIFLEIPVEELRVDLSYQRDSEKRALVRKIAREWSWRLCGTLTVGERDNVYFVIDGGGRVLAATKRGDISDLPCMVFPSQSSADEADVFLGQTNRNPVRPFERFKAELVKGNPIAIKVKRLIDDSGRVISPISGKNQVACIEALMKLMKSDEEILWRIWPVVKAICEEQQLPKRLIDGLFCMERHAVEGQSVVKMPWSAKLRDIGFKKLMSGIQEATEYNERYGALICAEGIIKRLNYRATTKAWISPSTETE